MINNSLTIKEKIESIQNISLYGHRNIDGDAVGAMLGLGHILEKLGKKVSYFTTEKPDKAFDFIDKIKKIKPANKFSTKNKVDANIFIDFSDYSRIPELTKNNEAYFDDNFLIIFDHHEGSSPSSTDLEYKDSDSLSTCDLVYEFCKLHRAEHMDAQFADYIYMGILTDTGNFTFGNNQQSQRSMKNAQELLVLGANKEALIKNLFYQQTLESVKFASLLIKRAKKSGKILYTYYTHKDIKRYGIQKEQASIRFVSIIAKIAGPQVIMLIKTDKSGTRGSLRTGNHNSKTVVNCAHIARDLFGGGGHKNAAGFSLELPGSLKKKIKKTVKMINQYLE